MKKLLSSWAIKVGGSALLLGVLFWLLPLDEVYPALRSIPAGIFVAVLAIFLLAHVAAAMKWRWLMGSDLSMGLAIRAHFAGLAANLCLPGAVGGDTVRAALAYRQIKDSAHLVAVALIDRLIDMLALITLTIIGLFLSQVGAISTQYLVISVLGFASIVGGIMFLPKLLALPWVLIPKLPARKLAEKLIAAFSAIGGDPIKLLSVFAFSFMIQAVFVGLSWWIAIGVAASVNVENWLFAWPFAKVIAVVPISLNGLGVREAALAGLLAPYGAEATLVVAAGLVWQGVLFVAGGIGGVIMLLSGKAVQANQSSAASPSNSAK